MERTCTTITGQIISDFPNLTLHDISHLRGVWALADQINGRDFILNPIECFVLGGAILLHDSALSFTAYGGPQKLRESTEWRDIYQLRDDLNDQERETFADFYAIRQLHAAQAQKIATQNFHSAVDGTEIFIIEDVEIRTHLGATIGEIAASHHWPIEQVESEFATVKSPPAFLNSAWTIDRMRLSCLLRCADAAHIDGERAPDHLLHLVERQGVSLSHWMAQNNLGKAFIPDASSRMLRITSMNPFDFENANAWWVAYDAIQVLDKELKSANETLTKNQRPKLAVGSVEGAGDPSSLSSFVGTDGWSPTNTSVHVGDISKLMNLVCGKNLYGANSDELHIVLRELIQNAADAVKARCALDPDFENSKIKVSLTQKDSESWELRVQDNGVGMSKRVLCGPLISVGDSFWLSELAISELPGLIASKFNPIGEFGIGFLSVFELADEVSVSTRPWSSGASDVNRLLFPKGNQFRPILVEKDADTYSSTWTTTVTIEFSSYEFESENRIAIRQNNGAENVVSFVEYVLAIVAGLDVDVEISCPQKTASHEPIDWNCKESIIRKIEQTESLSGGKLSEFDKMRLTPMRDENECWGFAAVSLNGSFGKPSIDVIGGLLARRGHHQGRLIGLIKNRPADASRSKGQLAAPQVVVDSWIESQVESLRPLPANVTHRAFGILSCMGFDAVDDGSLLLNGKTHLKFRDLCAKIAELGTIVIPVSPHHGFGKRRPMLVATYDEILDDKKREFLTSNIEGEYIALELQNGRPCNEKSCISYIHRCLERDGHVPKWKFEDDVCTVANGTRMRMRTSVFSVEV